MSSVETETIILDKGETGLFGGFSEDLCILL